MIPTTPQEQEVYRTLLLDAQVGDKVRFVEEVQAYTVRARGRRYLVLNKPFNPKRTVLYTIVDTQRWIRGRENLVFGAGAEDERQCMDMICRLEDPVCPSEISHRNNIPVVISAYHKAAGRFCGFCHRSRRDGPCGMCGTEPVL